ncbi:hypothetical protein [Streptantibioticus silvisoli]|uniref:hypothetical protein n=1 Tax=Streptantibioticus silvisoli TaxID=2705255 RepID=UPI0024A9DDC4|nr:hypothetical protein [Streptantibioticus silvisoli]
MDLRRPDLGLSAGGGWVRDGLEGKIIEVWINVRLLEDHVEEFKGHVDPVRCVRRTLRVEAIAETGGFRSLRPAEALIG